MLTKKLRGFKLELCSWNLSQKTELAQIPSLVDQLKNLERIEEHGFLLTEQRATRHQLREKIQDISAMEAIYWHQRCKLKWLKAGDENTKLFHCILAARKRKNSITEVPSRDGNSLLTSQAIEKEFIEFNNLRFFPTNLGWRLINASQSVDLERVFSEEVIIAMNSLGSDKSAGPDGCTAEFLKYSWNTIKHDIMDMFADFY